MKQEMVYFRSSENATKEDVVSAFKSVGIENEVVFDEADKGADTYFFYHPNLNRVVKYHDMFAEDAQVIEMLVMFGVNLNKKK